MPYFLLLMVALGMTSLRAQVCTITAQNVNQDLCTACATGTNPAVVNGRFTGQLNISVSYTIDAQCLSDLVWDQYVDFYINRGADLTFAQDPTVALNTTVTATPDHKVHSGVISAYGQLYYSRAQSGGDSYTNFASQMQSTAGAASLPVDLLHWQAEGAGADISLQWSTAREAGAAYFEIHRSTTGRSFVPIGRVPAAGYSSVPNSYAFTDTNELTGELHYYRLLQYDYDGTMTGLGIRAVRRPAPVSPISFYPNPAAVGELLSLQLAQVVDEVVLHDATGHVIRTYSIQSSPHVSIRLPHDLTTGFYLIRAGAHIMWLQVVA